MLVHRRRALLHAQSFEQQTPVGLSNFDRICADAAHLLESPSVAQWVAVSYPLVVVDEAQDLDTYRLRMLRALAVNCEVIAAADEFQNLDEDRDCSSVLAWLRTAQEPVRLTTIHRTAVAGLLRAALALRNGSNVLEAMRQIGRGFVPRYESDGLRILEPHATLGPLAWAVADALSQMGNEAVILTPDAHSPLVTNLLTRIQSPPPFNRNRAAGATFGPYQLAWDRSDGERASALMDTIPGHGPIPIDEALIASRALQTPEQADIIRRLQRIRSLRGSVLLSRDEVRAVVDDVLRSAARFGPRRASGRRVMTIHRAKNREFEDVVVLWPHSA
jgi:hypothetical protein